MLFGVTWQQELWHLLCLRAFFFHTWTSIEAERVAGVLAMVWQKGPDAVKAVLSNAYSAPCVLRCGLLNASAARCALVLQPPSRIKTSRPHLGQRCFWPGRADIIAAAWGKASAIAHTRSLQSKKATCEALAEIPFLALRVAMCVSQGFSQRN